MTFEPGRLRFEQADLATAVVSMAETAASIANATIGRRLPLPGWRSWAPPEPRPPQWGDRKLWQRAIDAHRATDPPVARRPVLLHRDFHPLNLLWQDERVASVIDWVNACVGHPHAELGHCRWNLAVLTDPSCADDLVDHYRRAATDPEGRDEYDPVWDLETPVSLLGEPIGLDGWRAVGRTDITPERAVAATEAFLSAALDRM